MSEPFPIDWYLAGVAFSCISQGQALVVTIGVWSLRNLPPQIPLLSYAHYSMFIHACKGFYDFVGIAGNAFRLQT